MNEKGHSILTCTFSVFVCGCCLCSIKQDIPTISEHSTARTFRSTDKKRL